MLYYNNYELIGGFMSLEREKARVASVGVALLVALLVIADADLSWVGSILEELVPASISVPRSGVEGGLTPTSAPVGLPIHR